MFGFVGCGGMGEKRGMWVGCDVECGFCWNWFAMPFSRCFICSIAVLLRFLLVYMGNTI